jgi:hypothetical protein
MALDNTQPKVGAIAQVAILAVATLLFTRVGLLAYFDRMAQAEEYRKWGSLTPEALHSVRNDEKQRLSSGAMPIDKAMQTMATKGRLGASPDIMPASSATKDLAPLQGWARMPAEVPPAMSAGPAAPPPATEVVAGDAGAAVPATAPDAAAPEPKHP